MLKRILAAALALCLLLAGAALAEAERPSVPANPKRVVDLSGCSDVLTVMQLNVVGTANARSNDYTRVPAYLEKTLEGATVLGASFQASYDMDAIKALEPDLIVIGPQHEAIQEQLKAIAPTVMVKLALKSWKMDMLSLGEIFTRRTAVATWLDNYTAKAHKAGERIKAVQGKDSRYLALMISGGQLYAFVDAGFGGILYNDLGLAKPTGMSDRMGINMTTIGFDQLQNLTMDHLILLGSDADLKELRQNENWLKLPVVQAKKVKELPVEPYLSMCYSCVGADALLDEIAGWMNAKAE